MKQAPIICIVGDNGTGKDTFASYLRWELRRAQLEVTGSPILPVMLAYADTLKYFVKQSVQAALTAQFPSHDLGWEELTNFLETHKEDVYRPMLQGCGELLRGLRGQGYFANPIAKRALELSDMGYPCIITDGRYPNEVHWVENHPCGVVIGVMGDNKRTGESGHAENNLHASERYITGLMERIVAGRKGIIVSNTSGLYRLREQAVIAADKTFYQWTERNEDLLDVAANDHELTKMEGAGY